MLYTIYAHADTQTHARVMFENTYFHRPHIFAALTDYKPVRAASILTSRRIDARRADWSQIPQQPRSMLCISNFGSACNLLVWSAKFHALSKGSAWVDFVMLERWKGRVRKYQRNYESNMGPIREGNI